MAAQAGTGMEVMDILTRMDSAIQSVFCLIPQSVYNPSAPSMKVLSPKDQKGKGSEAKRKSEKRKPGTVTADANKNRGGSTELVSRLHGKVAELRAKRKADDPTVAARLEFRKRKRDESEGSSVANKRRKNPSKERKDDKPKVGEEKGTSKGEAKGSKRANDDDGTVREDEREVDKDSVAPRRDISNEIEIAGVAVGDAVPSKEERRKEREKRKRSRKETKLEQLERELEKVEAEKKVRGETDDADDAVRANEMEKAMLRASGASVKDRAGKIRKTIRKEKRKKEKSKEEWAKRKEAVEADKAAKQEKREERLKERREGKGKKHESKGKGKKSGVKGGSKSKGKR